jgi:hypothetical protein
VGIFEAYDLDELAAKVPIPKSFQQAGEIPANSFFAGEITGFCLPRGHYRSERWRSGLPPLVQDIEVLPNGARQNGSLKLVA